MRTVEGFWIGEETGVFKFRCGDGGAARVFEWRCPPERLSEFGPLTRVRLTLDGADRVVGVDVLSA